jgi:multidrug resistance protein, MATE family
MMPLAAVFIFVPEPLLSLFETAGQDPAQHREIVAQGIILMRFVAVFCFFDALNLIYSGAIKGAGDTRFIMWTIGAVCLGLMIVPVYVAVEMLGAGLYTVWTFATVYACALGVAFMLRYRHGAWKRMRVIEEAPCLVRAEAFSG